MSSSLPTPFRRRTFLKGIGATIALPFLESIPLSASFAAATLLPPAKRLLCFGVTLGLHPGSWLPQTTGRDFKLSHLLSPLSGLRDKISVVSNIDHPSVSGGHKGAPAFLSGTYLPERIGESIVINNSLTLDQKVAPILSRDCRFESLQFAATTKPGDAFSWNKKGIPMHGDGSPDSVFKKLFVNDANPQATQRRIEAGKSVLDTVLEDSARLARQVSKADQSRLDQYMTSIRDVEAKIERQRSWVSKSKPTVEPMALTASNYHDNLGLMMELAALAIQTDSTRTLSFSLPGGGLPIDVNGLRVNDYHGQSHHGKDPKIIEELVSIELEHMKHFAGFLQRLRDTSDGESNLLETSQILFGSGLGNGSSHSNRNLPILLAGGGLRHGQHIACPEGTPLTNLFVTMMQRLGLDEDSFAGSTGNLNNEIA